MTLYLLMKQRDETQYSDGSNRASVHATYETLAEARARVERIGRHPDNRRYPLIETSTNSWRLGPEEDQGFFGHAPMRFWIEETEITRESAESRRICGDPK